MRGREKERGSKRKGQREEEKQGKETEWLSSFAYKRKANIETPPKFRSVYFQHNNL